MGWSPGPGSTSGPDVYVGTDGDDIANGLEGDDRLTGGLGADRLRGGPGADTFIYLAVADSPYGAFANDQIQDFETGLDKIDLSGATGATGSVAINRSGGVSSVFFQGTSGPAGMIAVAGVVNGPDVVAGSGTVFYFAGDGGSDVIVGSNGVDYIDGGLGADTLTGGGGRDVFQYPSLDRSTPSATDLITDFTTGVDQLQLGGAIGSDGLIAVNRSGGISTVYFQRADGAGGYGQIAVSGAVNVGDFLLTSSNVTIYVTGSTGADVLVGGPNVDYLFGGDGDDALTGGPGADVLTGGAGADTFYYTLNPSIDSPRAKGDVINGFETGVDRIDMTGAFQTYSTGGSGFNIALNRSGAVSTIYYVTNQMNRFNEPISGTGSITVYGVLQATDFVGLRSSDRFFITGDAGDDVLYGGPGADTINGGGGNDTIVGGLGVDSLARTGDILTGGAGADTFVYLSVNDTTANARDVIKDFTSGQDRIDVVALGAGTLNVNYYGGQQTIITFTPAVNQGSLVVQLEVFAYGQVRNSDIQAAAGVTFTGNGAPADLGVAEHAITLVGVAPHTDAALALLA